MTMRNRGSALEGFNVLYDGTGHSDATVMERITTKCVLDFELVQQVQNAGGKPLDGVPLGTLPELYPFDMLKRPLLEHAREFVRQIGTQGFVAQTNPEQFRAWGPYSEKVGALEPYFPEAGNPFAEQREAQRVWGYQGNEFDWNRGCAFLIQGEFTRHARYGHIDETGRVIV